MESDVIADDLVEKILKENPLGKEYTVRWKTYVSLPFNPTEEMVKVAELFIDDKPMGSVRCRLRKDKRLWSAWVWGSKLPPRKSSGKRTQLDMLATMMRRVEKVVLG